MTAFRPSAIKATTIAAFVGPVLAWILSSIMRGEALSGADFAAASMFVLIISVPITLFGLVLIGLPLTLLGERIGGGSALPIALINGAVSATGFLFAHDAEWPMVDVQQTFWLTLGCTALLFTVVYLGFDREHAETTNV